MEKKVSDLEHSLIKKDIEKLNNRVSEGFSSVSNAIKSGFDLIRSENKRNIDLLRAENKHDTKVSNIQRDNILAEQKKTNGRVKALEKVTSVLSLMRENKKITGLVLYSVYNILEISTIDNVMKVFQWIKLMI